MRHRLTPLAALAVGLALAGCTASPSPDTTTSSPTPSPAASDSAQSDAGREVTVTVDGEGIATDVTVTVTDGSQSGSQQVTESNVELPYETTLEVAAGSEVQVAAQNGTSEGDIQASVTVDGDTTVGDAQSGGSAVTTVESEVE